MWDPLPSPMAGGGGCRHRAVRLCCLIILSCLLRPSSAIVFLKTAYNHFLFDDAPAAFGASVGHSEICGGLHLADPLNACSVLRNGSSASEPKEGGGRIALVVRGGCSFEEKVRNAQVAGFRAVVVYDNQDNRNLISMIGDSQGIRIPSVFVSKAAGEIIKQFAEREEGQCRVCLASEEAIQTVLTISLISLIVIGVILAIFLFARNLRARRSRNNDHSTSLSAQVVNKLTCLKYNSSHSYDSNLSETCTICLEDYKDGESLRVLPCQHEFHAVCVDSWLTKWGTFCPLCKHDMRTGPLSRRISEQTPLLPC